MSIAVKIALALLVGAMITQWPARKLLPRIVSKKSEVFWGTLVAGATVSLSFWAFLNLPDVLILAFIAGITLLVGRFIIHDIKELISQRVQEGQAYAQKPHEPLEDVLKHIQNIQQSQSSETLRSVNLLLDKLVEDKVLTRSAADAYYRKATEHFIDSMFRDDQQ